MSAGEQQEPENPGRRTEGDRVSVDLECQLRVGTRAWRKAHVADLTPGGFQVTILEMPPRGTAVYIRIPGLQMLQAEVCWTKLETAGCKFCNPLSTYVYDHVLAFARG